MGTVRGPQEEEVMSKKSNFGFKFSKNETFQHAFRVTFQLINYTFWKYNSHAKDILR